MEDCLFCMIAEGKIPSKKLYEDDQVVAFYDINPQAKVHFLVVPKKHIQSAAALTEEDGALLGHIFAVIAKLAKEVGLDNGYRVISNVGGSLKALDALAEQTQCTIVGQAAVLAEGDAAERKDIIFLEPLPLFFH